MKALGVGMREIELTLDIGFSVCLTYKNIFQKKSCIGQEKIYV